MADGKATKDLLQTARKYSRVHGKEVTAQRKRADDRFEKELAKIEREEKRRLNAAKRASKAPAKKRSSVGTGGFQRAIRRKPLDKDRQRSGW